MHVSVIWILICCVNLQLYIVYIGDVKHGHPDDVIASHHDLLSNVLGRYPPLSSVSPVPLACIGEIFLCKNIPFIFQRIVEILFVCVGGLVLSVRKTLWPPRSTTTSMVSQASLRCSLKTKLNSLQVRPFRHGPQISHIPIWLLYRTAYIYNTLVF
jgi:hypothetical protein